MSIWDLVYDYLDWRMDSYPAPRNALNDKTLNITTMKTLIIDPGHGMSNRQRGKYDPGACAGGHSEAAIVMDWANELRGILKERGHRVIRTRVDDKDPCPVSRRDDIATSYGGDIMISLHCNAANGRASGTETFYRGADDRELAKRLTDALCAVLGTPNRGPKTEHDSQHASLAVMEFPKCWLIELGFIDHLGDRAKLLDPAMRRKACVAIADLVA